MKKYKKYTMAYLDATGRAAGCERSDVYNLLRCHEYERIISPNITIRE